MSRARGDVRGSASDLVARTATQVSDCRQTPQRQIADDVAQQRRGQSRFPRVQDNAEMCVGCAKCESTSEALLKYFVIRC